MITYKKKSRLIKYKGISLGAYMTLEASFIIPLTFVCFIIIMLYTFYLYDHLVVYQSCYLAALRGSQIKNATNDAVKSVVDRNAEELLDRQVYQYQTGHSTEVSPLRIKIDATSSITNLISEYGLYKEKELVSDRGVSITRIDPVDYIRNAQRF